MLLFFYRIWVKLIIPKSKEKLESLKLKSLETNEVQDGEFDTGEEIDVTRQDSSNVVRAVFKKSGRAHDVDILVEQNN